MEPTQNPIKAQVLDLYLQLSEITARMENQLRGGVSGDYRSTYYYFRESMFQLYDLSHWHIEYPDENYNMWRKECDRTDRPFVMASIKMYERYIKKLVDLCIIDIKKDLV